MLMCTRSNSCSPVCIVQLKNLAPDVTARVEFRVCDAALSWLPDASVDALLCDPPFGKKHGSCGIIKRLYPHMLAEGARVVRPGGVAVILTMAKHAFESALVSTRNYWRVRQLRTVDVGGIRHTSLFVLERTDCVYAASEKMTQFQVELRRFQSGENATATAAAVAAVKASQPNLSKRKNSRLAANTAI
jgi:hypothetical protein